MEPTHRRLFLWVPRFLCLGFIWATMVGVKAAELVVLEQGNGGSRELVVRSTNVLDATVLIFIRGQNVRSTPPSPILLDTAGRTNFVAARIDPAQGGQLSRYSFQYVWKVGGQAGTPDNFQYSLPFDPEGKFQVSQGYLGAFSHKECGEDQYALDWRMPEGTRIRAARDGTVVAVRQHSNTGGPQERFRNQANYITIRHNDGTYGDYVHLKRNGALVKPGQSVQSGQPIGLSGNTGFSSEPHLHFCVYRNLRKGSVIKRETLPFMMADVEPSHISPRGSCVPKDAPLPITPPAELVLNGIWKQAGAPVAIINGEMFREGEKGVVKFGKERCEIVCHKITGNSVTVTRKGGQETELILRAK